jgi:hypothetical protein
MPGYVAYREIFRKGHQRGEARIADLPSVQLKQSRYVVASMVLGESCSMTREAVCGTGKRKFGDVISRTIDCNKEELSMTCNSCLKCEKIYQYLTSA